MTMFNSRKGDVVDSLTGFHDQGGKADSETLEVLPSSISECAFWYLYQYPVTPGTSNAILCSNPFDMNTQTLQLKHLVHACLCIN